MRKLDEVYAIIDVRYAQFLYKELHSKSPCLRVTSDAFAKRVFQIPSQQVSKTQIQTVYPSKINASTMITIRNMPSNNNSKFQTLMQGQIAGKPINSILNKQ